MDVAVWTNCQSLLGEEILPFHIRGFIYEMMIETAARSGNMMGSQFAVFGYAGTTQGGSQPVLCIIMNLFSKEYFLGLFY